MCEYLDYRGEQIKAHDLLFHVCIYDQVFQFDGTLSNSLKVFQFQVISSSSCPFYFSVFKNKFNSVESNFLLVIYIIGIYIIYVFMFLFMLLTKSALAGKGRHSKLEQS